MSENGDPLSARFGLRGPSILSRIRDERIEPATRLVLSRHEMVADQGECREAER